jgi:hypothetical protein
MKIIVAEPRDRGLVRCRRCTIQTLHSLWWSELDGARTVLSNIDTPYRRAHHSSTSGLSGSKPHKYERMGVVSMLGRREWHGERQR